MSRVIAALLAIVIAVCFPSAAGAQEIVGKPPTPDGALTAEQENPEDVVDVAESPPSAEVAPEPVSPPVEEVSPGPEPEPTFEIWKAQRRSAGRTHLILGQALHGAGIGIELALLAKASQTTRLGLGAAGGLVGGVTAGLLARDGIDPGHASALNSGALWGFFLAHTASRSNYSFRGPLLFSAWIVGQAAGMGLGELAWRVWKPTHGQTWVVDSSAFWITMFATGTLGAALRYDFPPRRPVLGALHFFSALGGLGLGAAIASDARDVSVGRVIFIDSMGVVGGLVAPFIGLVATRFYLEGQTALLLSMTGAAIGLGVSTVATSKWRTKQPPADSTFQVHLGLSPVEGGAAVTIGGRF